jgi:hypothetical protein
MISYILAPGPSAARARDSVRVAGTVGPGRSLARPAPAGGAGPGVRVDAGLVVTVTAGAESDSDGGPVPRDCHGPSPGRPASESRRRCGIRSRGQVRGHDWDTMGRNSILRVGVTGQSLTARSP